jgi:DNA-binding transcriptional regulator YiaG
MKNIDWDKMRDSMDEEERELYDAMESGEIMPPPITDDPTDVRSVRIKMGLSQGKFAKAFGIPLQTLQNWEAGRRGLSGASLALIKTIRLHPEAVMDAVAS